MTRSIAALVSLSLLVACAGCRHAKKESTTRPSATAMDKSMHEGRIVLFDGHDLSKWQGKNGGEPKWKITEDGAVEVVPHSGDIETKEKFGDCVLHVEFRTPIPAEGDKGQHRGNSGIFLKGQYEIQVLESYGLKPTIGDCGALYSITAPSQNMAKPPMEWQTYDITFHAPKFDAEGKKTENGKLTLIWNGVKVQDNIDIPSPTRDHNAAEVPGPGPIELQDHGFKVQYRNIWVEPVK